MLKLKAFVLSPGTGGRTKLIDPALPTMSSRPRNRLESAIRFLCAFAFFGLLATLLGIRLLDVFGTLPVVVIGFVLVIGLSLLAARHGDSFWERF